MCVTPSVGCTQYLRNAGEGHDPLFAISFPVGVSLTDSLTAHLIFLGGTLFAAVFSTY